MTKSILSCGWPAPEGPTLGGDVGMIERGPHLGLALKSRQPLGIPREGVGQDLDDHLAFELRIPRAVDLTHPALTNEGDDLVHADASAWRFTSKYS